VRRWFAWWLSVLGSGCLTVYTVGESSDAGCGDGQVVCGDICVAAGTDCDECPEGQVRCGDSCGAPDTCMCDQGCDAELEMCGDGVCVCRLGLTRCGSACVDTRTDPDHCGSCDGACGGEEARCQEGDCVAQCQGARTSCGTACVDTTVDSLHCGTCEKRCKSGEVCLAGVCRTFDEIGDCAQCPCPGVCDEFDSAEGGDENGGGECCDSPFVGGPVCVEEGCD